MSCHPAPPPSRSLPAHYRSSFLDFCGNMSLWCADVWSWFVRSRPLGARAVARADMRRPHSLSIAFSACPFSCCLLFSFVDRKCSVVCFLWPSSDPRGEPAVGSWWLAAVLLMSAHALLCLITLIPALVAKRPSSCVMPRLWLLI